MKQFAKLSLAMIVVTGFIASALNPHSIQAQAPKPVTPVAIAVMRERLRYRVLTAARHRLQVCRSARPSCSRAATS